MAYRSWSGFRPYVPVAKRRAMADRELAAARKRGKAYEPVSSEGRTIARSFWGQAWCRNLEAYSDYANRLPRGRRYLANGQVVHLAIGAGTIDALVMGTALYTVKVKVSPLAAARWKAIGKECAGKVGSLVELLQGKLSGHVMEVVTRKGTGLFPAPREIEKSCSCPDWAGLCKHLAAVLYGVGARLDERPELLFLLRGVDHLELVGAAAEAPLAVPAGAPAAPTLAEADLAGVFGIELEDGGAEPTPKAARARAPKAPRKAEAPAIAAGAAGARVAKGTGAAKRAERSGAATKPGSGSRLDPRRITARELLGLGLSRSAIQTWLEGGVLERTAARGVYATTPRTQERLDAARERLGLRRVRGKPPRR